MVEGMGFVQINSGIASGTRPGQRLPMDRLCSHGLRHAPQGVKNMNLPDDPTLRLLPGLEISFSETEFLRQQVAEIEAYVERFPWDERELRALAWIEANASQYRQQWQIRTATSRHHRQTTPQG